MFGNGVLEQAGTLAKGLGTCALIVTGRDQRRAKRLQEILNKSGVASSLLGVAGEPDLKAVEQGVAAAKKSGCDLIISYGGGSAIDAGKAIAAMLANPGELTDYLEIIGRGKSLTKGSAPFIAIPTTAGTGSEVTRNAVLASPEHRVKVSLRSPLMLPRIALVDPELTYDLPPAITASTGLDALTQLIEPFVCARANPMTDALCVEGMGRAARSLLVAFRKGPEKAAREDMALASLFGGLALANAGLGAVHGFAGPLGGMFQAPHGEVCAALLPHVMEMNIGALRKREPQNPALARYARVASLLTGNERATAEDGAAWVQRLVKNLQVPRLRSYGIQRQDADELVEKAAKSSSMKANPITLSHDELRTVFESVL